MTYCISDIHGEYDKFIELLDKINIRDTDTLYILGDILDRGPHPIKTLLKIMDMPNAVCLVGNHELMARECLEFFYDEVTEDRLESLSDEMVENLMIWLYNGSKTTTDEFTELDLETKKRIVDFLKNLPAYKQVSVGEKEFILVHAGLGEYPGKKNMEAYPLSELVWTRANYNIAYFEDKFVVSGHTPTQSIKESDNPGYIFRKNNHIAIDCGACYPKGRLAAICLDTDEEFYSSENTQNEINNDQN